MNGGPCMPHACVCCVRVLCACVRVLCVFFLHAACVLCCILFFIAWIFFRGVCTCTYASVQCVYDKLSPHVIVCFVQIWQSNIQRLPKQKTCWLCKPSLSSCYNKFLAIQYTKAIGDALIEIDSTWTSSMGTFSPSGFVVRRIPRLYC